MENPPNAGMSTYFHSKQCLHREFLANLQCLDTYCGLCGSQGRLMRTECCNSPICDFRDPDVLLSYPEHGSCYRNHDRYTICSLHKTEHPEDPCDWHDCTRCEAHFSKLESYVGLATSNFNYQEDCLANPPKFEPTHCSRCQRIIKLNSESHTNCPNGETVCCDCRPF